MHLDPRKLHRVYPWAVLVRQSPLTQPLSLGVVDHFDSTLSPQGNLVVHLDPCTLHQVCPPWLCCLSLIVVFDQSEMGVLNYEDMPSTQNLGLHHIIFV